MTKGSQGSVLWSIQTLFTAGSVGGLTDGQLLDQFLSQRNEQAEVAFAALVSLHGPTVWDVCRSILADPHAAEDAFQATFLILVRKARSIRRRDAVGPWLHSVARKVAIRAKVTAARRQSREEQESQMQSSRIQCPSLREDIETMHEEINRLPDKYRAVVVLCHLEGRTHAEVARLLKCPVGTISVRVSRARDLLRSRLIRRGLALSTVLTVTTLASRSAPAAIPTGLTESTIKAAIHLVSGKMIAVGMVPATVTQLTQRVLQTMTINKLTLATAAIFVAGSITAGVALIARDEPPVKTKPPVALAKPRAMLGDDDLRSRVLSSNNLRQIGLAMNHFVEANNQPAFPAFAITKDGKALLSWRVAILPYLNQKALYDKFHLDEPWDSPHNKPLLNEMPDVYAPITARNLYQNSTFYQGFFGPGAFFDGNQGTRLPAIRDGAANTLMIAEAANPVPWTKPEDIPFDKVKPLPALGGIFENSVHILFVDTSVFFISKKTSPDALRALITIRGGDNITRDTLQPIDQSPHPTPGIR